MKVVIFGSRTLISQKYKENIKKEIEALGIERIKELRTSGGIKGICHLAIEAARDLYLPIKLYWPNPKYRQGMFHRRSVQILTGADFCLLFHDGKSKGTLNELNLAKKMGIPFKYFFMKIDFDVNDLLIDSINSIELESLLDDDFDLNII
ncbi:MAG: hypothetical protein GXP46_01785 [Deferribacteres bacterium]|nr:hypothetical protein [Deferribacteres bacterium]